MVLNTAVKSGRVVALVKPAGFSSSHSVIAMAIFLQTIKEGYDIFRSVLTFLFHHFLSLAAREDQIPATQKTSCQQQRCEALEGVAPLRRRAPGRAAR